MPTVILPDAKPIIVNGARRDIPANKPTPVTDDELAALRNSNTTFEIVGGNIGLVAEPEEPEVTEPEGDDTPADEGTNQELSVDPPMAPSDDAPPVDPAPASETPVRARAARRPRSTQE